MKVYIDMVNENLLKPLKGGEYELREGATVADLIHMAIKKHGAPADSRVWDYALYLLDQRPVLPQTTLYQGARLKILWKVFGG